MRDWNVVVSVREGGYTRARQLLQRYGPVHHTDFYNVLVMKVDDIRRLVEDLRARVAEDPTILAAVARVMPAARCFDFRSHDDFEAQAREAALAWVPDLVHKSFHVRLHRRGLKEQFPGPEEERFLDHALLEALKRSGTPGRITFEDPDAILASVGAGRDPPDFSDCSKAALRVARALARDQGACLIVLHVAPLEIVLGKIPVLTDLLAYREALDIMRELLEDSDLKYNVETQLRLGHAAAEILDATEELRCDLIVMGAHGRTGLGRLLRDSVAEAVLRGARCPVLTVKTSVPDPTAMVAAPDPAAVS